MRMVHVLAHLPDERQEDDRRNGMAHKRGGYQNDRREDNGHAIQTQAADAFGDDVRNGVQQTGAVDDCAERETSGSKNNDGPQEVVEVFVSQDTSPKEYGHRNDGNDAHVSKVPLKAAAETP
jgi:hypothetical protein